jgi:hypothetical protein
MRKHTSQYVLTLYAYIGWQEIRTLSLHIVIPCLKHEVEAVVSRKDAQISGEWILYGGI